MSRELKVGDKIKDNDPRVTGHRILTIVEILPNGVIAEKCGKRRTYLRRRIHTDGKPRKNGLSLIIEERTV